MARPAVRELALATAFAMALAGCMRSDPARLYVLTAAVPRATTQGAQGPSVAVARVSVPAYLDRSPLTTRRGASELTLAEFDRWGEPLDEGIARTLADNLSGLLPSERVTYGPAAQAARADFAVAVFVLGFECVDDREVVLSARWSVTRAGGEGEVADRLSVVHVPLDGRTAAAAVAAHSRALADLSREIAAAIAP
ncbi:MAG: membrane integrity-associated transporter subunit PqiC [Candidatus Brocadiaceae bacterium]|nr:membrane integrity-associated transporter subunit PqiC [Candidatus Brocadiaceae bacterium]